MRTILVEVYSVKLSGKKYQRLGKNILLILLEVFLCLSLVMTGSLFWINNSYAVIPDNDPTTMIDLGQLLGEGSGGGGPGGSVPSMLGLSDDGVIPVAGGVLVSGNGDLDDNKEEPFILKDLCKEIIWRQTYAKAVASFRERRTVTAYKDFGHLKVIPAAWGYYFNTIEPFIDQRLPVY